MRTLNNIHAHAKQTQNQHTETATDTHKQTERLNPAVEKNTTHADTNRYSNTTTFIGQKNASKIF